MSDKFIAFIEELAPKLLSAVILLVVGIVVIKLLMKMLKKIFAKSKLDAISYKFILSLARIVLYIVLVIISITMIGVDPTSLIALLSVAGLAVSLAIQGSLANVAGGFILLFTKPFHVGDFVEVDSVSGTVRSINILQTKLLTFDNKAIFVPNGQISEAKIVNFSAQDTRRLDLTFAIGYSDNFEKAKAIIKGIIEKNPLALSDPAPIVRVCELAESSVHITVKVWVVTGSYWDLNFDLLESVKTAFDENNITIPFKQLDVTVKNIK